MTARHNAEPWLYDPESDFDNAGSTAFVSSNDAKVIAELCGPNRKENARRLVACVNACAGIDTGLLELAVSMGAKLSARLAGLSLEAESAMKREHAAGN